MVLRGSDFDLSKMTVRPMVSPGVIFQKWRPAYFDGSSSVFSIFGNFGYFDDRVFVGGCLKDVMYYIDPLYTKSWSVWIIPSMQPQQPSKYVFNTLQIKVNQLPS